MVEIRFRRMAPTDTVRDVTHEKLMGLPGAREGALSCQLVIDHDPAAGQVEPRESFRAHLKLHRGAARKPVEATACGALAANVVNDVFELIERHILAEQRRAAVAACP